MDERALLLLGLLKAQSQHGYQINEFIEHNLSRVTAMKKPTAYALLDRLSRNRYVSVHSEQEGNRPQRKVYSITPKGDAKFYELLRHNLTEADRLTFAGDIGLMFIDHLSTAEAIACLEKRLARINDRIAGHPERDEHNHGLGVNLALDHVRIMLEADREWLSRVISDLRDARDRDSRTNR